MLVVSHGAHRRPLHLPSDLPVRALGAVRRFLIDTDTASDDAVALLMALREPAVRIEAVTVVAGNAHLDTCVRNALISVEKAETYAPPVHPGMAKPLLRDLFTAEFVHGEDGMGDMGLPDPVLTADRRHAVDAIIDLAHRLEGELEIITLGPLTNVAMALLREPELAGMIERVHVMGGAGLGPGNLTPLAEFNFFVDAEAAHVVVSSAAPKTIVGWDVSTSEAFMSLSDIDRLRSAGPLGRFAARCNASLLDANERFFGRQGFDLPDPVTVAAALYPDMVTASFEAYGYVEHHSERGYGQFVIDRLGLLREAPNLTICQSIDALRFKEKLYQLLA